MTIQIEDDLSPENCESRKLEWIGDYIYDFSAPDIVNKEVIDFIQQGYKIGQPASTGTDIYVGVYATLKKFTNKV